MTNKESTYFSFWPNLGPTWFRGLTKEAYVKDLR